MLFLPFLHKRQENIIYDYAGFKYFKGSDNHKYTDLSDREPLYRGGFIWDYIDQSIDKKDRYGRVFQAYGGDFGDRPSDYSFSGNGITYGGDRSPSPKMQEVKFNYQNISVEVKPGQMIVKNKNLFVNTDAFDCVICPQHRLRNAI